MSPRSLGAALVTAALLVTGCGPHRGPASSQYAFVVFTNESLNQADVYAFGTAGDRVRLGTVFGAHTDTLRLDLRTISGSGTLSVRARRENGWTRIDVEDTGDGLPAGWTLAASRGTGLRNLSARLEAEFGAQGTLSVAPREGGGVVGGHEDDVG